MEHHDATTCLTNTAPAVPCGTARLVGETTFRDTRRSFEFTRLELEVKGIEEQVIAYRVEKEPARPQKVRGIEGLRAELIATTEELP